MRNRHPAGRAIPGETMFGIKRLKKNVREAVDEIKDWKRTRTDFGKNTWSIFRNYFGRLRGAKMITKAIPFDQAVRDWGLVPTERGIAKAKTAMIFVSVFFYIIAIWCGFYLFRMLFVNLNIFAAAACVLGLGTGLLVGTINLWRWKVLSRRKYVPFPSWLKGGMRI